MLFGRVIDVRVHTRGCCSQVHHPLHTSSTLTPLQAYYQLNIHTLSKEEAQIKMISLLCQPSMTVGFFPVKVRDLTKLVMISDNVSYSKTHNIHQTINAYGVTVSRII